MLRCRPYDICFVVSAHPALEDAIGRVVRVTVIDVQQGGSTVWALEHPLRVTLKQDVMHRGRFWPNGGTVSLLTIYDDWLRPLRDSEAPDEMLMIAGLPAAIGVNTALNDAAHSSLAPGQCSLPRPIGESLAAASLFSVAC